MCNRTRVGSLCRLSFSDIISSKHLRFGSVSLVSKRLVHIHKTFDKASWHIVSYDKTRKLTWHDIQPSIVHTYQFFKRFWQAPFRKPTWPGRPTYCTVANSVIKEIHFPTLAIKLHGACLRVTLRVVDLPWTEMCQNSVSVQALTTGVNRVDK